MSIDRNQTTDGVSIRGSWLWYRMCQSQEQIDFDCCRKIFFETSIILQRLLCHQNFDQAVFLDQKKVSLHQVTAELNVITGRKKVDFCMPYI